MIPETRPWFAAVWFASEDEHCRLGWVPIGPLPAQQPSRRDTRSRCGFDGNARFLDSVLTAKHMNWLDFPQALPHITFLTTLIGAVRESELSPGRGNSPGEGTQPNGNNGGESQKVTGGSRDLNSIHNPMTGLRITPT